MFLSFSPFTFLFLVVYLITLILIVRVRDFMLFWLIIEFLMLTFIGISYTLPAPLSPLMLFFLVQTLSSFLILFSYLLGYNLVFSLGLILKLGVSPFLGWFLYSVVHFPPLVLTLSCTLHKLPLLLLMTQFNLHLPLKILWTIIILNVVLRGFIMLTSLDMRYLLVASSVANNSWFLLGQLSGFPSMLIFFIIYSSFFSGAMLLLSSSLRARSYSPARGVVLRLVLLSGLPPSPLFFSKLFILLSLPTLDPLSLLFLLLSSSVVCSYLIASMNLIVLGYSSSL